MSCDKYEIRMKFRNPSLIVNLSNKLASLCGCIQNTLEPFPNDTYCVYFEAVNKLGNCYQVNGMAIIEWVKVEIQSVQLKWRHFIVVVVVVHTNIADAIFFHVIRFTSMIMMFNMFAFAFQIKKICSCPVDCCLSAECMKANVLFMADGHFLFIVFG